MKLLSNDTLWLFLSTSSKNESEDRHILDVCYGIKCLENKKIKPNNIKLIIDGDENIIKEHLKNYTKAEYFIEKSSNIHNLVKNINYKNIVTFITGHGRYDCGIDALVPIKPYPFIQDFRNLENVENIIIYFGQCYAGIFNYIEVHGKPKTILIGATNLYPSISTDCGCGWSANLFLYHLFQWINNPVDIDGDNKYTVMDSFKYVGAKTNEYSQIYKGNSLRKILSLLKDEKRQKGKLKKTNEKNISDLLKLLSIQSEITTKQTIHYNHQEPWILNANIAREIEF